MSSFCTAKATHICFSKTFPHICVSLDVNFNKSLNNDVVSFEQLGPDFLCLYIGLGTTKNKVPWYVAVFSRVLWYVPQYIATVLNFAVVTVKLPAVVAIWVICQHLMFFKFKPPQLSVLSFIFNEILIYIVYYNRNLYFKLKNSSGE